MNQWVYGTEVGKRYHAVCIKKSVETEGEDEWMVGRDAERKLRLRIEVGCRPGITRDLTSKLRMLVIRVFMPSGIVPSKSRVFISLTCAHLTL